MRATRQRWNEKPLPDELPRSERPHGGPAAFKARFLIGKLRRRGGRPQCETWSENDSSSSRVQCTRMRWITSQTANLDRTVAEPGVVGYVVTHDAASCSP
jgi:hypothetical protein